MREAVAGFHYLPVNLFGHLRERVAPLKGFFFDLEHGSVKTVLPDALDAELRRAQLYFKTEQSRFRVKRPGVVAAYGAKGLQLFISEQGVQALHIAFAVSAARLGHDGVTRSRFPFVRSMIRVKHLGDRPEELAHSFAYGKRALLRAVLVPFFVACCIFRLFCLKPEHACFGLLNLALDFRQLGQSAADHLRIPRPEETHLFLQRRKLAPPLLQ